MEERVQPRDVVGGSRVQVLAVLADRGHLWGRRAIDAGAGPVLQGGVVGATGRVDQDAQPTAVLRQHCDDQSRVQLARPVKAVEANLGNDERTRRDAKELENELDHVAPLEDSRCSDAVHPFENQAAVCNDFEIERRLVGGLFQPDPKVHQVQRARVEGPPKSVAILAVVTFAHGRPLERFARNEPVGRPWLAAAPVASLAGVVALPIFDLLQSRAAGRTSLTVVVALDLRGAPGHAAPPAAATAGLRGCVVGQTVRHRRRRQSSAAIFGRRLGENVQGGKGVHVRKKARATESEATRWQRSST